MTNTELKKKIFYQYEMIHHRQNLNAFITLMEKEAYERADAVDNIEFAIDAKLPLSGVTLAVKDNIALKGAPLTCGSKILEGYISPYTATALERLIASGCIVMGKTNMDEFAMGSSNETSAYGKVLNPINEACVPGGSSGGSAVAVAAGFADAALGSETGGSVRQPAAFCGVIGLKPTYGRISRYGLVAFGSSLDQIGIMTQNIKLMARIFCDMAGYDKLDNTASHEHIPNWRTNIDKGVAGLRIGLPKEYFAGKIQMEIASAIDAVKHHLKSAGAIIEECSLPHTKYAIPTYYIIAPAECSSNLARYDGIRYGARVEGDEDENLMMLSRQNGFGKEVKRRIMLGTYVLSAGYYDAYYKKAQKVRRLIKQDFDNAFQKYDLLLTPTTPTTAFKFGEKTQDPIAMYLSDVFTAPANLAGIPAISVPFGSDHDNKPIGIQFMANDFREDLLFQVGQFTEDIKEMILKFAKGID